MAILFSKRRVSQYKYLASMQIEWLIPLSPIYCGCSESPEVVIPYQSMELDSELEEQYSNLQKRYEEMMSRLDGTYQMPK